MFFQESINMEMQSVFYNMYVWGQIRFLVNYFISFNFTADTNTGSQTLNNLFVEFRHLLYRSVTYVLKKVMMFSYWVLYKKFTYSFFLFINFNQFITSNNGNMLILLMFWDNGFCI